MPEQDRIDLFTAKAQAVSAVVHRLPSMARALDYVVDICEKKEACQLLASGCEEGLSNAAEELCETKQQKIIAAPNLSREHYDALSAASEAKGFACKKDGLRGRLAGIDIGLTLCQGAVADTGSVLLDSDSEETRLASMISEIHVAAVPVDAIAADFYDAEERIAGLVDKTPSYTAFITGASRTADIERVLALGVHGPLELHILLLDEV